MAWWVAWACFVGMFIARISKNRTIRNVVFGVFLAPTFYAILWFSVFGGIGLRQERQARELEVLGTEHFQDPTYFQSDRSELCYDVPQEDVYADGALIFTNTLLGITPVCKFDSTSAPAAWFNVMDSFSYPGTGIDGNFGGMQYHVHFEITACLFVSSQTHLSCLFSLGFGPFLSGLSIFTLAIYFVTSSDSGSLVVDTLASNGTEEHHWLQRMFWAFTEGGVATGLLVAGGTDALSALQAASIVFGLPFNFLIFVMCWSINNMCRTLEARGQENENIDARHLLPKKTWTMPLYGGIFNIFEYIFSFGNIHPTLMKCGMNLPSSGHVSKFVKNIFFPFVPLYHIYSSIDLKRRHEWSNGVTTVVFGAMHFGWILLFCFGFINNGVTAFGWTLFFINACILTSLRMHIRGLLGISGNIVGDFIAGSFLYPQGLLQMELQLAEVSDLNAIEGESHIEKEA